MRFLFRSDWPLSRPKAALVWITTKKRATLVANQNCPEGGGAEQGGMLYKIRKRRQTKQFSQNGIKKAAPR